MLRLRPFRSDDADALLHLFRDTVRRVNLRDYSPEQIAAWASEEIDPRAWADRFEGRFALVAEGSSAGPQSPIGFAELEPDGHIDRFYVAADHVGQGVGRALMEAIVAEGKRRGLAALCVEASITARPFFQRHGFTELAEQIVICRGVEMKNFRMRRDPL